MISDLIRVDDVVRRLGNARTEMEVYASIFGAPDNVVESANDIKRGRKEKRVLRINRREQRQALAANRLPVILTVDDIDTEDDEETI